MKSLLILAIFFLSSSNLYAKWVDEFKEIKSAFVNKEYIKAIGLVDRYLNKHPYKTNNDIMYLIKGEALYRQYKYKEARDIFIDSLEKFPKTELKSKILFSLGCCYHKLQDYKKAIK